MPRPPRGLDENTGRRDKGELWRQTKAAATAPRASHTSVDRGTFVAGTTADGQPQMYFGELPNGDVGLIVRRENGTIALMIGAPFAGDRQLVTVADSAGNPLASEAYLASWGAAFPRMSYGVEPVDGSNEKTVAATTWTTVFQAVFDAHNPFLKYRFTARVSAADTAGQVQLTDVNGTPLSSFLTPQLPADIAVGTVGNLDYETAVVQTPAGKPGDSVTVLVQVQRTAGTGNVIVRPGALIGMSL